VRFDPKDEIMMKNDVGVNGALTMQVTKSVGGSVINSLDISTQTIPGNFGIRVVEAMPTNLSDVWRERKNTQLGYACQLDNERIPQLMLAPMKVDYPTDDDSDDNVGFSIKVSCKCTNFHNRYLN
jgi:hypothetical protein